jgi:hypothetical protein
VLAVAALAPSAAPGEVVRLKDASTLKGRLVHADGDSLTFRTSFGTVRLGRSQIVWILFDDSTGAAAPDLPGGTGAVVPPPPAGGKGAIAVSFKDRELSSKIEIDKRRLWDEHVAANHIVVELLVDGKLLHTAVDSTMDKEIEKGHITQVKNDVELKDFSVEVPAGMCHATLIVRNADPDRFRDDFDPDPINLVLAINNLDVRAGEIMRVDVGINRGKLKMGKPKLYLVE